MKRILPLFLGLFALASVSLQAAVITYDSSVVDWFQNGLTRLHAGRIILANDNPDYTGVAPTNLILAQGIGSTNYFPVPLKGDYAGVTWTAPVGEIVLSIQITGSYRSEPAAGTYGATVYGGTSSDTQAAILLSENLPVTRSGERESYTWTIALNPNDAITKLQFNAWEALIGGAVIQGGSSGESGYTGMIDSIVITTAPIPETSTLALSAIGIFAFLGYRKLSPLLRSPKV